jgi:hypothetical protein
LVTRRSCNYAIVGISIRMIKTPITELQIPLMAAKRGSNVLFCTLNRTGISPIVFSDG